MAFEHSESDNDGCILKADKYGFQRTNRVYGVQAISSSIDQSIVSLYHGFETPAHCQMYICLKHQATLSLRNMRQQLL